LSANSTPHWRQLFSLIKFWVVKETEILKESTKNRGYKDIKNITVTITTKIKHLKIGIK
jgi:hypothetical protein